MCFKSYTSVCQAVIRSLRTTLTGREAAWTSYLGTTSHAERLSEYFYRLRRFQSHGQEADSPGYHLWLNLPICVRTSCSARSPGRFYQNTNLVSSVLLFMLLTLEDILGCCWNFWLLSTSQQASGFAALHTALDVFTASPSLTHFLPRQSSSLGTRLLCRCFILLRQRAGKPELLLIHQLIRHLTDVISEMTNSSPQKTVL